MDLLNIKHQVVKHITLSSKTWSRSPQCMYLSWDVWECFHLVVHSGLVWQYLTPRSQTTGTAEQQIVFPSYKRS